MKETPVGNRSILFLDKVFLNASARAPCGVEVFNLNLLKDLRGLRCAVWVPAHPAWARTIEEWCPGVPVEVVRLPWGTKDMLGGMLAVLRQRRRRFDVLLLGNVGNRLIPMLSMIRLFRMADRCVLIAHREPFPKFVKALERWPTTVLAVNRKIVSHFRDECFPRVEVGYGITEADRFFPRQGPKEHDRECVDFCVVGHLDRKWKGADTGIAAFRRLPGEVREKCRLHLAAYSQPPSFPEPNIVAYSWLPFEQMGDFLRRMDVMLVPSRDEEVMRETFSQVMVQGMLTALPMVVSHLPILVEKLDRGGGFVFHTVDDLAGAMAKLAADPGLRRSLGEQGRATALARYVWNTEAFVRDLLFPESA